MGHDYLVSITGSMWLLRSQHHALFRKNCLAWLIRDSFMWRCDRGITRQNGVSLIFFSLCTILHFFPSVQYGLKDSARGETANDALYKCNERMFEHVCSTFMFLNLIYGFHVLNQSSGDDNPMHAHSIHW